MLNCFFTHKFENIIIKDEFFSQSNNSRTDGEYSLMKQESDQMNSENDFQPAVFTSINHHAYCKNNDFKSKSYLIHNASSFCLI